MLMMWIYRFSYYTDMIMQKTSTNWVCHACHSRLLNMRVSHTELTDRADLIIKT